MLIAEAREKIRTTQLVNRLQNHALGQLKMSSSQIRATEILLKKVIPDLTRAEISGDQANPLLISTAERQARARQLIRDAFAPLVIEHQPVEGED